MPEYVLVEFDTRFATVVFVDAFPGRLITEDRIEPRKPLSVTARRPGGKAVTLSSKDLTAFASLRRQA